MTSIALVTRTPVTRTIRKRIKFEFWLDVSDPCQGELADWLANLKTMRLFHEVLRELLRWAARLLPTARREIKATLQQGFNALQPNRTLPPRSTEHPPSAAPQDDLIAVKKSAVDNAQLTRNLVSSVWSLSDPSFKPNWSKLGLGAAPVSRTIQGAGIELLPPGEIEEMLI